MTPPRSGGRAYPKLLEQTLKVMTWGEYCNEAHCGVSLGGDPCGCCGKIPKCLGDDLDARSRPEHLHGLTARKNKKKRSKQTLVRWGVRLNVHPKLNKSRVS